MESWLPDSWRGRPATQLPVYPDAAALARVEARIAAAPALTDIADTARLRTLLAEVAAGRAFVLQGGDCAESFAEFGTEKVRMTFDLLRRMAAMLTERSGFAIVPLARIAGQFAKPRTRQTETGDGAVLPSYRGDAINGVAFDAATRTPDPSRLLAAHHQAQATVELLETWSAVEPQATIFTSHEALMLNYEQALTRFDAASGRWWATSGHMIWVGDRTRDLDGAHVEFARGVANPIGVKCGPGITAGELLQLARRIDPGNEAGRLILIGRFGASKVPAHLPALMRATRAEGLKAIWSIDPMHGNTRVAGTRKTRLLPDILSEISSFFDIAAAEGVHPGGVHLEMTGADVTECLGGALVEADLPRRYLTHCDPRLNRAQALDIAAAVALRLASEARRNGCRASDAA